MKAFITNFLIAIISAACASNSGEIKNLTDLEAANLKGRVKQVKESYNKITNVCCPASDKRDCRLMITVYNENGNTLETSKVSMEGDTSAQSRYLYNDQLKCSAVETYQGNRLLSRESNELTNGLVTEVMVADANGILMNTYKFDYKNGLLTAGETWTGEGKLLNSFVNSYQNGKVETEIVKDSQGNVFTITKNKRNSHGDIVESQVTHPRDNSEYTLNYKYDYDQEGNWVKQTKIYNDDIVSIRIREIQYF